MASSGKRQQKRKQSDSLQLAPPAAKRSNHPAKAAASANAKPQEAAGSGQQLRQPAPELTPAAAATGAGRSGGSSKPRGRVVQPDLAAVRTSRRRAAKLHPAGISSRGRPRKPKTDPDAMVPQTEAAVTAATPQQRGHATTAPAAKAPATKAAERDAATAVAAPAAGKVTKRRGRPHKRAALVQLAKAEAPSMPAAAGRVSKRVSRPSSKAAVAMQPPKAASNRTQQTPGAAGSHKHSTAAAKPAAAVRRQQQKVAEPTQKKGKAAPPSSKSRRRPRVRAAAGAAVSSTPAANGQRNPAYTRRSRSNRPWNTAAALAAVHGEKAQAQPKKPPKQKAARGSAPVAVDSGKAETPARPKMALKHSAAKAAAQATKPGVA